jgi:hypothetical protein
METSTKEALLPLAHKLYELKRDWLQVLLTSCRKDDDGNLIVPAHIVASWLKYALSTFDGLSLEQKHVLLGEAFQVNLKITPGLTYPEALKQFSPEDYHWLYDAPPAESD